MRLFMEDYSRQDKISLRYSGTPAFRPWRSRKTVRFLPGRTPLLPSQFSQKSTDIVFEPGQQNAQQNAVKKPLLFHPPPPYNDSDFNLKQKQTARAQSAICTIRTLRRDFLWKTHGIRITSPLMIRFLKK